MIVSRAVRLLPAFLLLLSLIPVAAKYPTSASSPPAGYKLVWSDDFSTQPNGAPDPSKWIYEEGFIRNQESQYYTRDRRENVRIENGLLVLEARKEQYQPPGRFDGAPVSYTSGALETRNRASWRYGRIEVKAKLPSGNGVWPAFWTLGSNNNPPQMPWPKCGEIDFMEYLGRDPGLIHTTVHYQVAGQHQGPGTAFPIADPSHTFHVYAVDWDADHMYFSVDGKVFTAFDVKRADDNGWNPFRQHHYLILDLALGGSWGGDIDDSIFPQRLSVAWVRVYQKTGPATAAAR